MPRTRSDVWATLSRVRHGLCSLPLRLALAVTLSCAAVLDASGADHAPGGAVATGHPLATDAAVEVLAAGGNAIDAAVAAALTLGVVDGHNSGIGGGCFILIRTSEGELIAIDGRETAPSATHPDMFRVDGKADVSLSQTGALASGTPGALAAYALALEMGGSMALTDLLQPGIRHAEGGFEVDATYVARLASVALDMRRFEGSRALMVDIEGRPLLPGRTLRQPDLARTYRQIAEGGTDAFYRGAFAEAVGTWMAANGGLLTAEDFANYKPVVRTPVRSHYRGHQIIGFPPPSSGGIHVAQILQMLEVFDMPALADQPDQWVHLMTESMKLAFADRAHWLGDSDFTRVPSGLVDPVHSRRLAKGIDLKSATAVEGQSLPPDADSRFFDRHTAHLSAADTAGNWVAITATINTAFGSKVVVPGTGVILNNQMDDFSIEPGVPNHFGLVGSEANKVEPGKRPLSSMSPTIVLGPDEEPWLAIGAAGGPTIISQVAVALVRLIDFEQSLPDALAAPRFHHQWIPDQLRIEPTWDESVRNALDLRGHQLQSAAAMGRSQAVMRDADGAFHATADPRGGGSGRTIKP